MGYPVWLHSIRERTSCEHWLFAVIAVVTSGCSDLQAQAVNATDYDLPSVPAAKHRDAVNPLLSSCTFVQKTGTLTVPLNAGETAFISKRLVNSAILVQGETCDDTSGATTVSAGSKNVKIINVKPDAPSGHAVDLSNSGEVVVIDVQNGTFGLATSPSYEFLSIWVVGGTRSMSSRHRVRKSLDAHAPPVKITLA